MRGSLLVAEEVSGHWGPVGRLDRDRAGYRFVYLKGAWVLPGFVPFAGMPELEEVYESDELFPLFANRLLARSRPEFDAYLSWSGFARGARPDPIAILGVTSGRRATDQVEVFPCPAKDEAGRYECDFFVHGMRWIPPSALDCASELKAGDQLTLRADHENPKDPHAQAVLVTESGERIGYVPRYLCTDVIALRDQFRAELSVTVRRLNADAPLQQRVLCRVSALWPDGFQPCGGIEYQTIVEDVALC